VSFLVQDAVLGCQPKTILADVSGDFAEGSVSIYFNGAIMPLAGQLTMTNPTRSLVLESEMVDNSPGLGLLPSALNAVWWGLGGGREARIMVSNTSGDPVIADVCLDFQGERHESAPLTFAPHETKILSVTHLLGELKVSPAQAPEGGISIIGHGSKVALIAQGKITDPNTGFSTTLNFPDPKLQRASALHASGVPIGMPSTDSPFSGTGAFVPHVVVRNLTAATQTVTISVEYPGEEGPTQAALVPLPLEAYTTKDIPLDSLLASLPLPLPFCSIRIQCSGPPGSVIGEVSSVEAKGDLVIDSRLANERDGWAGSGAHPWHLDEETESILFLTNMSEKSARIGFDMVAGGVHYYLTRLKLKPHETRAIDLRKVRDEQKPDLKGHKVPAGASDGSVVWSRLDHVPVMGRLVVLQRHKSMASNYDCYICDCAADYIDLDLVPSSWTLLQDENAFFDPYALFQEQCGGYQWWQLVWADAWTSLSPSVAYVREDGFVTALSPGTASIRAMHGDFWYSYDNYYMECIEHWRVLPAYATVKVFTFTVSLSPSTVQPGSQTTAKVETSPATQGEQVSLLAQEVQYSGGHNHLNRPLGSFGATSGTTDGTGKFQTTYTASSFGGQEVIKATIRGTTKTSTLTVQVQGLSQLADGANFNLIGSTSYHVLPNNHYGTSAANSDLVAISNDYAAAYPGSILEYNDQSLPKGGLFDIGPVSSCPGCVLWQMPHEYHRVGINCDVRKSTVPPERWGRLEDIFRVYGSVTPKGDHWHLTL
jgi:hypothetical protein